MSKRSCVAAESLAEAFLRMARVNCNFSTVHSQLTEHRFHACMRICAREKLRRERYSMSKRELRSSGKPRRGVFANGAGEL